MTWPEVRKWINIDFTVLIEEVFNARILYSQNVFYGFVWINMIKWLTKVFLCFTDKWQLMTEWSNWISTPASISEHPCRRLWISETFLMVFPSQRHFCFLCYSLQPIKCFLHFQPIRWRWYCRVWLNVTTLCHTVQLCAILQNLC